MVKPTPSTLKTSKVKVELEWEGNDLPTIKPNTWVTLLRTVDGEHYEKVKIQVFTDKDSVIDFGKVPTTDKDGKVYTYRIVQTDKSGDPRVPEGFEQKLIDITWTPDPLEDGQVHTFKLVNEKNNAPRIPKTSDTSGSVYGYIAAAFADIASVIGGVKLRKKDDDDK